MLPNTDRLVLMQKKRKEKPVRDEDESYLYFQDLNRIIQMDNDIK
jgi:hypothetical protein